MKRERSQADINLWLSELAEQGVPGETDLWPRIARQLEWSRAGSAARMAVPPGEFERVVTRPAADDGVRQPRGRRRQAFELVVGVVAFAAVAALLLVVFRGWDGASDDRQAAVPTSVTVRQELLYVVSHAGRSSHGLVTAFDMATGETAFSIETGPQVDAVASPDGRTLYIASVDPEPWVDELTAYDVVTREMLWTVPLEHRVHYQFGVGPSTLAVSPDGSQIYVYSAERQGEWEVRTLNTVDGSEIAMIGGLPGCPLRMFPSGDGASLFVACLQTDYGVAVQVADLAEGRWAASVTGFVGTIVGAVPSSDGAHLFVLSERDERYTISAIDMSSRLVVHQEDVVLNLGMNPLHSLQLIALSPEGWLFFGVGTQPPEERGLASQIRMYSIQSPTFWRESARIDVPLAVTGPTLVAAPEGNDVFVAHNAYVDDRIPSAPTEALIQRIRWSGGAAFSVTLPDQEVIQMFSGWRMVPADDDAPASATQ